MAQCSWKIAVTTANERDRVIKKGVGAYWILWWYFVQCVHFTGQAIKRHFIAHKMMNWLCESIQQLGWPPSTKQLSEKIWYAGYIFTHQVHLMVLTSIFTLPSHISEPTFSRVNDELCVVNIEFQQKKIQPVPTKCCEKNIVAHKSYSHLI